MNPGKRKKLYRRTLLDQNNEVKKEIETATQEEVSVQPLENLEQPVEIVEEQPVVKTRKKKSVE